MRVRLIRLYPLYLLGGVLGIAMAGLAAIVGTPGDMGAGTWIAAIALTAAFLPAPFVNHFQLYPFNNVSWSLIWEVAINALYALVAPRLTTRWLTIGLAAGAALILWSTVQFDGLATGSTVFNWIGGPQRVGYSFLAGIAVHGLWRSGRAAWCRVPPMVAVAILIAVFVLRPAGAAPAFDAIAVLIVFPLLVLAATADPSPWLQAIGTRLGLASYAVYALHAPFVKLLQAVLFRSGELSGPARFAVETGFIVMVTIVALLADRWYDRPVRAWLSRRSADKAVAPVAAARPALRHHMG